MEPLRCRTKFKHYLHCIGAFSIVLIDKGDRSMIEKKKTTHYSFSAFFFLELDSNGASLDRGVNCFGTVIFGVIEGKVSNRNTRLQLMHLAMEQQSVLSV